ncbi:MAG TPA: hypothetical protein VGZ00_06590 [Candidatus Baltobacteraceae bacterium]|jgi:hypothetical protein|nr:hypothetical protein [Candidatus Baltobacteraceae bacterium]
MSISLANSNTFREALRDAHEIELSAYLLAPSMRGLLEDAAARGAHVHVRLPAPAAPGQPDLSGKATANNAQVVDELRAHGIDASLVTSAGPQHAKLAILDEVLWLDDRNFPVSGPDTVLRDDKVNDVQAARAALDGRVASTPQLTFTKHDTLTQEVHALNSSEHGPIDVESETFGPGTISRVLDARALQGDPVRLLVARREHQGPLQEQRLLAKLASDGVQIRIRAQTDKLAVSDTDGWIGSANATAASGWTADQFEWGLEVGPTPLLQTLRDRFMTAWKTAKPFSPEIRVLMKPFPGESSADPRTIVCKNPKTIVSSSTRPRLSIKALRPDSA